MTSRMMSCPYPDLYQFSKRQMLLVLVAMSALSLGGCSIDLPSKITPERIQLVTENYSQSYVVADVTAAHFDQMASHYSRYGSGEAELIVSYDPYSKKNTAMRATDHLHRISAELSKRGMTNLKASILAVDHSGDQAEMVVGYKSVTAQPPEDCAMMPGYADGQAAIVDDYKLGCSVNTMVSRQVAHPEDLAGRVVDTDGDGRRAGAVVEPYRSGQPGPALSGFSSTGN